MVDENKHYDMINLPRFTLYGAALGGAINLMGHSVSDSRGLTWGILVRETALCSTLSGAAFLIGGAIHNQISKHNREEREKAGADANKDAARTL